MTQLECTSLVTRVLIGRDQFFFLWHAVTTLAVSNRKRAPKYGPRVAHTLIGEELGGGGESRHADTEEDSGTLGDAQFVAQMRLRDRKSVV